MVGGRTATDIRDELERLQPWLKFTEIIKIKDYTHVFKIICSESDSSTRLLTDGLEAFDSRITPNQMTQETYTHIPICYNCYEYETHATKDCTKTTIICSECVETGHKWTDCTNATKKCINCVRNYKQYTDHRTLAAKCTYCKTTIDAKIQKTSDKMTTDNNKTYTDVAKEAVRLAKTDEKTN